MKLASLLLLLIMLIWWQKNFAASSQIPGEKVIVLEGTYLNKNIYVLNDYGCSDVGFCTFLIKVNGKVTTDETYMPVFEIDLSALNIPPEQQILIEIFSKAEECCYPKVLNPYDILPEPQCVFKSVSATNDGIIKWVTENEKYKLPFIIEQKRWNKWIFAGEVMGKGGDTLNTYAFKPELVSGLNIFRIKQKGYKGKSQISPLITIYSTKPEILWIFDKKTKTVDFSNPSYYELYNSAGKIMKIGYGIRVEMYDLPQGTYYLFFGNTSATIKL